MKNWTILQDPYLRETLPNRLGELSENLARISSLSQNDQGCDTVAILIEESKFFIEWTAMDAGMDLAAELVELQVQLARWQLGWQNIWSDRDRKLEVANQAKVWSNRVMEMSGLLSEVIAWPKINSYKI
jgi:hypothetical protein